jgi:hypothetical protein
VLAAEGDSVMMVPRKVLRSGGGSATDIVRGRGEEGGGSCTVGEESEK